MKQTEMSGIFKEKNKIFTENPNSSTGTKVYNEKLVTLKNKEYRSWNPYRSKLAAAIYKGLKININPRKAYKSNSVIAYLSKIAPKEYIKEAANANLALKYSFLT